MIDAQCGKAESPNDLKAQGTANRAKQRLCVEQKRSDEEPELLRRRPLEVPLENHAPQR